MSAVTPTSYPTFKIEEADHTAQENRFFGPNAIKESIKERGESFIDAAILIIENSTLDDHEKGIKISNLRASTQNRWKTDEEIDINKLHILLNYLCNEIKPCVDPNANLENKKDLDKLLKNLNNAENHVNWKERQPLKTVIQLDDDTVQVRIDTPITEFTKKQENEWLRILNDNEEKRPKWFTKLPAWKQKHFIEKVKEWQEKSPGSNLGTYMGVPPTTIRGYPGARNAYQSDIYTFKRDTNPPKEFLPKPVSHVTKVRSGHISPSKMKRKKERREAAQANLEQLILAGIRNDIANNPGKSNFLVDLQTLISPPLQPADIQMDSDRLRAIKNLRVEFKGDGFNSFLRTNGIEPNGTPTITLVTSNHPVNKMRALASLFTGIRGAAENSNTLKVLNKQAKELILSPQEPTNDQQMAIDALQKIKAISGPFKRLRNLFTRGINHNAERAALEQIAVSGLGGIRIGSCMSGKDREEAVSQHVAAMSAFYTKYGSLPPIPPSSNISKELKNQFPGKTSKDFRDEYENMVAKEFLSCHGQQIAEANAKGAKGMKESAVILGKNISKKVHIITSGKKREDELSRAHYKKTNLTKLSNLIAKLNRLKAAAVKSKKQHPSSANQTTVTWASKTSVQKLKSVLFPSKKMKDEEYIELFKDEKILNTIRELFTEEINGQFKNASELSQYQESTKKNMIGKPFNPNGSMAEALQLAYPLLKHDTKGAEIDNREQAYIDTVTNFVDKMKAKIKEGETLTDNEQKIVSATAVYSALSSVQMQQSRLDEKLKILEANFTGKELKEAKDLELQTFSSYCSELLTALKDYPEILEGITKKTLKSTT